MNKLQRAVAAPMGPVARATILRSATIKRPRVAAPQVSDVDDADLALHYMSFAWYLIAAGTLALPVLILLSANLYDAIPWGSNAGAFIIAGGALLIGAAFPVASQYRALSVEVMKQYAQTRTFEVARVKKLTRLMFVGAACAELPSIAGLLYFFMTRETIGSLLLCAPAVIMMLVLYRPGDLRSV
ncbi:MAG: hypothetical protein HY273_14395 [Gammaproteobacteria bacterium]|nr:hypothetical protein [Gammaproteobacteria bacterium]